MHLVTGVWIPAFARMTKDRGDDGKVLGPLGCRVGVCLVLGVWKSLTFADISCHWVGNGGLGPRSRGYGGWVLKNLLFPLISERFRALSGGPVVRQVPGLTGSP